VRLLAIETSCDETCAAVMEDTSLLSNVIASQEVHQRYGGVVPELASRAHTRQIVPVVRKALDDAKVKPADLEAIAVTHGPGLIGSLVVGISFAKGLAHDLGIPVLGINHLEGHLFSNNIEPNGPQPPFLALIISGGHTILIHLENWNDFQVLGETQDDAAGEAFDKVAKILRLPYPGGPQIERLASTGNPAVIQFPVAKLKNAPFDFSFSGLKTAVLYHVRDAMEAASTSAGEEEKARALEAIRADVAAAFQRAIITALVEAVARAHEWRPVPSVALAGGVACNQALRTAMKDLGNRRGFQVFYPRPIFCTDNAAMIALAAAFRLRNDRPAQFANLNEGLRITPRPGLKLVSPTVSESP